MEVFEGNARLGVDVGGFWPRREILHPPSIRNKIGRVRVRMQEKDFVMSTFPMDKKFEYWGYQPTLGTFLILLCDVPIVSAIELYHELL